MNKLLFSFLLLSIIHYGCISGALHSGDAVKKENFPSNLSFVPHIWKEGEKFVYDFKSTETTYSAAEVDGLPIAEKVLKIEETRIPVSISLQLVNSEVVRTLRICDEATFKKGNQGDFSEIRAQRFSEVLTDLGRFFYTYKSDTDALNRLNLIFSKVRSSSDGQSLFYKIQDIHQMQESVQKIPVGMTPGEIVFSSPKMRAGLGGEFVSGRFQLSYKETGVMNGTRFGYFVANSMGIKYKLPQLTTYTNFTFSMHVAIEGPNRGMLLFGEGQETATVMVPSQKSEQLHPAAVVQRQFSIRKIEM